MSSTSLSRPSDLKGHGFLFEQLVQRELRQKYQGSVLGLLWYLVNPLLLLGAYYLMFGVVLKPGFSHPSYPLFIMTAMVVWLFVQSTLGAAGDSLLSQAALLRKARFPREIIPTAVVTVQAMTFLALLVVVSVLTVAFQGTLGAQLLLLPVVVVLLLAFVQGLALAISALHAHFRDVQPIVGAILVPWFFVTPIFYRPTDITDQELARFALEWLNPVAPFAEAVRTILYDGNVPSASTWLYLALVGAVALVVGAAIFRRLQRDLAVML
ncbi:ABC transporter permease [Patulibacter minatonensis]|uniref:ABC transporter permease n=1 Tax=Patulibacter minatonensis TaxID=298163 RepID=UPI000478E186|nr:ABC transporter permease [Patulibacter minatonensis]